MKNVLASLRTILTLISCSNNGDLIKAINAAVDFSSSLHY